MEGGALVAKALLTSAQGSEVFWETEQVVIGYRQAWGRSPPYLGDQGPWGVLGCGPYPGLVPGDVFSARAKLDPGVREEGKRE